jgi:hypothetical protein
LKTKFSTDWFSAFAYDSSNHASGEDSKESNSPHMSQFVKGDFQKELL